jgi:hypothetical protein
MSHQDKDRLNQSTPNHQALSHVLNSLLATADCSTPQFQHGCSWTPKGLIYAAILWAWSDENALTQRFFLARKTIVEMAILPRLPAGTYQAFLKMLRKWTLTLSVILLKAFRQRMESDLADRFQFHGFAIFGVDGSRVALSRTVSNEQRFSPTSARKPKSAKSRRRAEARAKKQGPDHRKKLINSPQMWLTMMFHVRSGLPWDWRTGPSDSSERDHLIQMINELPIDALVVADAGFAGYEYWQSILKSGRHFLIRVGSNVRLLRGLGNVEEREGLVYLWPDSEAKKGRPPLVLRLVVAAGDRQPVYIVTSVDIDKLTDRQVLNIYEMRWGVELFFRHFKQTFGRRKLRSQVADHAELEATWSLIGLWAMSLHTQVELSKEGIPPERISVAGMLLAYRRTMREYKSRPEAGESLREMLLEAVIDSYSRKSKTSRDYPRKRTRKREMVPKVLVATPQQMNNAKSFKGQCVLGLTA